MTEKSLFIFGLGYTAQHIASLALSQGYKVYGTCRNLEKCGLLKEKGIEAFVFNRIPKEVIASATHILSSIPPLEGKGDIVIPLLPDNCSDRWLGYLSTTGVYGNHHGAWVDEESTLYPDNERLQRRVEAEKQWLACGGHVFRLAGIYGSGRSAIDDVKSGKARRIYKEDQVFSRVHVIDIARVLLASMQKPNPSTIYNVCDDEPAAAHEVVSFACCILKVAEPPLVAFENAELSAMGREFYSANRRVKNGLIKKELGIKLLYPTYRDGLRAVAENT